MKILQLTAENIKKLRAVSITPTGNVVEISGPNGAGKTSVLDSIFYALAGTSGIAKQPIRRGEEKATIRLDLGDLVVRRDFGPTGTRLVVESTEGARFPSPQKLLDDLLGALSFDPLAFTRMAPKEQVDTLRRLVPLDVDPDALDAENKRDYDARTVNNRQIKALTERVMTLGSGVVPDMDVTPVDETALSHQLAEATERNAAIERLRSDRERRRDTAHRNAAEARALREEAQRILDRAGGLEASAERILADVAEEEAKSVLGEPVNTAELMEQFKTAQRENTIREQQRRQRALYAEAQRQLADAKDESDRLTQSIEERTRQKVEALARATMPVPGLSFDESGVTFNGFPLEQASSAEQLRVSFAIAAAANPKLRIALVRDGSLLDEDSLALVAGMAEENDMQVWIERVDTSGHVGIVMEDGAIVADNYAEEAASEAEAVL